VLWVFLAAAFYLPPNPTVSPLWNDWSGGFWNVGKGNEQANTNAVAHVWFGAACGLAGYYLGDKVWKDGRRGALWGAVSCTALSMARLFLVHAPQPTDVTGCASLLAPLGCKPRYELPHGYGAELRAGFVTQVGSIWLTYGAIWLF
jgi:hypothetical protein